MTALRAPHPCGKPGCGALTHAAYCEPHQRQRQQTQDAQRGSSHERGYGARWRRARKAYLARHPLCAEHKRRGDVVAATTVDHIKPHRGDQTLMWDQNNWQSLCKPCHDSKTAREDGGFGNSGDRGE